MSNKNIFNTNIVKTIVNKNHIRDIVKFLIKYNSEIMVDSDYYDTVFNAKSIINTPINKCLLKTQSLGSAFYENTFALLDIGNSLASPEILTYRMLTFDTNQFGEIDSSFVSALKPFKLDSKILLNTSSFNLDSNNIKINMIQTTVIRSLLMRSYYSSDRIWMSSPSLMKDIAKIYSMLLSQTIARSYNLQYQEQLLILGLFSYYFFAKTTSDPAGMLRGHGLSLGLTSSTDIDMLLELMDEVTSGTEVTLSHVCEAIGALGISGRVASLNTKILNTYVKGWGPNIIESTLAIEYPPYFLYLLFLASSGEKIGIYQLLKYSKLQNDAKSLTDEIATGNVFVNSL